MKPVLTLIAIVLATLAIPASAQQAIQPGTIVGTFNAGGYSGNVIFTVPLDRNARVTDIKVHNLGAAQLCNAAITLGTTLTYFAFNAASQTIVANVVSGYGLLPGQTVTVAVNNCVNSYYVEIRGYYFTIP